MLIMFNLWTLLRFKILLVIGFLEVINSRELDICMDIMLKILTIKEVLELLLKLSMNPSRKAVIVILKYLRKTKVPYWVQLLMVSLLRELDGFLLIQTMMWWWVQNMSEWQLLSKNSIRFLMNLDMIFPILSQWS